MGSLAVESLFPTTLNSDHCGVYGVIDKADLRYPLLRSDWGELDLGLWESFILPISEYLCDNTGAGVVQD